MRQTDALVRVAQALCANPRDPHWGYLLAKATGLRSGTLYPILNAMLNEGWLEDGWEDIDPALAKRPARRYYTVTDSGLSALGAVLRRAEQEAASRATVKGVRFA